MIDLLTWLQGWYVSQCDGTWEHTGGLRIDTLDNPGGRVEVDVGAVVPDFHLKEERSELDWIACRVEQGRFLGAGGPENLTEILGVLRGLLDHS